MDFNRYILGGRLVADPELKSTQNGKMVCTFKVAVSKKVGQTEKQHFQTCVAWEARADVVAKYFKKGSVIGVEGPIWTRSWTDQNGQKRYASELEVDQIHFPMREPGEGQNGNAPSPAAAPSTSVYGAPPGGYGAPASYVPDAYRTPATAPAPAPQGPRGWENTSYQSPAAHQLGLEVPPEMAPFPGDDDLSF